MANSGYGSGAQKTPAVVIESAGFKQAIRELGLTEELITTALVADIESKPGSRLGELRLGAEILSMNKPENEPPKTPTQNNYMFIFNEQTQAEIKLMEDKIKHRLLDD